MESDNIKEVIKEMVTTNLNDLDILHQIYPYVEEEYLLKWVNDINEKTIVIGKMMVKYNGLKHEENLKELKEKRGES